MSETAEKIAEILETRLTEKCRKYPYLPQCKVFLEGMDAKDLEKPEMAAILEGGFERLEQALETGLVSKTKSPKTISAQKYEQLKKDAQSLDKTVSTEAQNILNNVKKGKTEVPQKYGRKKIR